VLPFLASRLQYHTQTNPPISATTAPRDIVLAARTTRTASAIIKTLFAAMRLAENCKTHNAAIKYSSTHAVSFELSPRKSRRFMVLKIKFKD